MRKALFPVVGLLIIAGSTISACTDSASETPTFEVTPVSDDRTEAADSVFVAADSVVILEVIRMSSSIGEVEFPHYEHVDDFGIECAECHHEVNAAALDIPHESYFEDFWIDCQTCHGNHSKPTGQAMSCAKCHHDGPTTLADQSLSSKVVIHQSCWDCHEVGRGADASSECAFCHSGPKRPGFVVPDR